jgi:cbb3-type cytochrome oxidase maturation protein
MSVILMLILASLTIAMVFLGCFIWAVRSGQFEDTCTPGMRILTEDEGIGPGRGNPVRSSALRLSGSEDSLKREFPTPHGGSLSLDPRASTFEPPKLTLNQTKT